MIRRQRIAALAAAAGLACAAWLAPAQAQNPAEGWPSKPVRVLVGFPPGGSNDILARLVAQGLGEAFKQPFVVENQPGASTIIAATTAAKAPAYGYTLLGGVSSTMTITSIRCSIPSCPIRRSAICGR